MTESWPFQSLYYTLPLLYIELKLKINDNVETFKQKTLKMEAR